MLEISNVQVLFWHHGRIKVSMPGQELAATTGFQLPSKLLKHFRGLRTQWNDRRLDQILRNNPVDIYHETGMFPAKHGQAVPTVLTVYDMSLIRYPECHPIDRVHHFERYIYDRLKYVDHIITISEFVRKETMELLGLDDSKVTAIPLAADPIFVTKSKNEVSRFLKKTGLPGRYLLYVGTLEPRKNLNQLVRALSKLHDPLPLICVGGRGWLTEGLEEEISKLGLADRIIRLGPRTDEELALLYSGATVFVYPSLYEGFGLPILEAMACGCPVVCSNRASLPEVAGDAAILLSAHDDVKLATVLDNVIEDKLLQENLSKRGLKRASQFSWKITAKLTLDAFKSCC